MFWLQQLIIYTIAYETSWTLCRFEPYRIFLQDICLDICWIVMQRPWKE